MDTAPSARRRDATSRPPTAPAASRPTTASAAAPITERVNLEIRGELLNAFNNINFVVGSANNNTNTSTNYTSQNFGQVTEAHRDTSTTYDPGGRLVQLVMRLNF